MNDIFFSAFQDELEKLALSPTTFGAIGRDISGRRKKEKLTRIAALLKDKSRRLGGTEAGDAAGRSLDIVQARLRAGKVGLGGRIRKGSIHPSWDNTDQMRAALNPVKRKKRFGIQPGGHFTKYTPDMAGQGISTMKGPTGADTGRGVTRSGRPQKSFLFRT